MAEKQGPASYSDIESGALPPPAYVFAPVTSFVAAPGSAVGDVDLGWSNPAHPEFGYVMIRRKTGGYPTGPTDGALVYQGTAEAVTDSGLPTGITYFYAAYAFDTWGISSSASLSSSEPLPPDYTAPSDVENFLATPGPQLVTLTWDDPVDPDYAGVRIMRKSSGYPTDKDDGTLVYEGSGNSVVDSGLPALVPQFYTAFAYDDPIQGPPPNYSTPGVHATATPELASPTVPRLNEIGIIEAITAAIGEQDTEIGGLRMTRLTAIVNVGDTVFPVEMTLGWPDSGIIAIDGIKYYYSGKTYTSFTGITHIASGAVVNGAAIQHRLESTVLDVSRERSALEQLRRSMLIEYAEGEDLNALARNIGVNRLPIFEDDDQFREVVKVTAYNPKGTYLGIELALKGLVGEGNFEIYEDLLQFPNTVFIKLRASSMLKTEAQGKTFLNDLAWRPLQTIGPDHKGLTLDTTPMSVTSVRLHGVDELFDFRDNLPSAVTYEPYPGASLSNAWEYGGSNPETTPYVVQNSGSHVVLSSGTTNTTFYRMPDSLGARIVPESYVEASFMLYVPTTATLDSETEEQGGFIIHDGAYRIQLGMVEGPTGGTVEIGLYYSGAGSNFLGESILLSRDQWHDVVVKKYGTNKVELWVDGKYVTTVSYSDFTNTTSSHKIEFGILAAVTGMELWVRQGGITIETTTDFWNARGATGAVATANPTQFNDGVSGGLLAAGDIGKRIQISGSAVTNSFGGNNNGVFKIESFVSPGIVKLTGYTKKDAVVDSANPTRITIPEADFTYPDDLGKKIVLSGSSSGNDGTYVIQKLLNPGTLEDLDSFDTQLKTKTNVCEVQGGAFTSEVELDWMVIPVFSTESNLSWELSDASSFSGADITLRQGLWTAGLLMQISKNDVLSSQILAESTILNTLVDDDPVQFTYWPFYLADPLGIVRAYLDGITAAGVIPEYDIE